MRSAILLSLMAILWSGCTRAQEHPHAEEQPSEPEPVVVTLWSDKTELFLEFPPLVTSETSRFAIHLTDLSNFQPLLKGRAIVELVYEAGPATVFSADAPSHPGIFGIDVHPPNPGRASLSIRVEAGNVEDRHDLGAFDVAPAGATLPSEAGKGDNEDITFLKEQQWSLDFATEVVRKRSMRDSLTVPAKIQPRSGGRIVVTAPITGRLLTSTRLPSFGTTVSSRQIVASIVPPTSAPEDRASLDLALNEAKVALALAGKEKERVQRLLRVGAIARARVEAAHAREEIAEARLESAQTHIQQYEASQRAEPADGAGTTFVIRSPLAGVVTALHTTDGAFVQQGDNLLDVVATDTVYVVGDVTEALAAEFRRPGSAVIEAPGLGQAIPVGRLVSVARFVDPETRTFKVIYQVDNRHSPLAVGQAVTLRMFSGGASETPAVAEAAVIDDGGQNVVFVQTGGESFERRPVQLGIRNQDYVQLTAGSNPGDRVVTRGAYLIRLAALSTQVPAHGHVH